jgi:hypothetical protein
VHDKRLLLCIVLVLVVIQMQLGAASVEATTHKGGSTALAMRWRQVSPAPIANSRYNVLNGISCPSARFCVAVGLTNSAVPAGGLYPSAGDTPLLEEFDGVRWSLMKSPIASGQLTSVSCVSIRFCVAVGSSTGERSTNLVLMDLTGIWSMAQVSNLASFPENADSLAAVSCVSSTFCLAVGADRNDEVEAGQDNQSSIEEQSIQQWQGASWSEEAGATTMWHGGLQAVSCNRGPICVADGYGDMWPGPPTTPVEADNGARTEVLDGSSWSSEPGYVPSDISCVSGVWCVGSAGYQPFYGVFTYTFGKWTTHALPAPISGPPRVLGVSCLSRHACTAVGSTDDSPLGAFISVFNGNKWSENQLRKLHNHVDQQLNAISCTPPKGPCIAVGEAGSLTSSPAGPAHSISIISSG